MGWKLWQNIINSKLLCYPILVQPFHAFFIIVLSLLLPLSFIILARLSDANFIASLVSSTSSSTPRSFLFLYTNPNILHAIVLLVTLATLINALTTESSSPIFVPRVPVAWMILCTMQLCLLGFGINTTSTTKLGFDYGSRLGDERSMLLTISKMVFFVGLHETMDLWCRTIVRPVVDDTIYGGPREERTSEKWVVAACFGTFSWWLLRDEVEALVVLVEVKRDLMMDVEFGDFVGLLIYYLVVVIGMFRILNGLMLFFINIFFRKHVDDHELDFKLDDKV